MLIQASKEIGEDSGHLTDSTQIPIDDQLSTSITPKKKQKSRRRQRKEAEVPQDDPDHEESIPTPSNNLQLSGEDRLELTKLMAKEIAILNTRVKKLERKRRSRPTGFKRLRKVGVVSKVESFKEIDSLGDQEDPSKQWRKIAKINQDENVNLYDEAQEQLNDEEMFGVNDLHGEEVTVEDTTTEVIITTVSTLPVTTVEVVTTVSAPTTNIEELTLTQTLVEIKAAKPKTIKAVTTDATLVTTVATTVYITIVTRLSTKGIVFHDQEEQENKQAVMEADRLLAKRLQTREREELTIE
ncbi:hypothetical protein Tco_1003787 [Tanacetum coccineum]|uniref:Uncharacterized protein n=1 Tax=Tanacetum coccineum TaxID=301880 RepID=A0ABQ5FAP8_9ASTR